jgi:hypothetical protein
MRAIAACQFTLSRFELWRRTIAVFAGSVMLVLLAWFVGQPVALPWPAAVALGLVALAALLVASSLLHTRPCRLRWDGREWHVGPAGSAGHESTTGELLVALDLGSWMLLRFQPRDPGHRFGATWLPVQRSGLEPQWHVLRCAVYSARPAPDAAQDPGAAADL